MFMRFFAYEGCEVKRSFPKSWQTRHPFSQIRLGC